MKDDTMTKLTKQQLDDIRDALQDDKRGLLQSEQRQLLAHAEAVQAELAALQAGRNQTGMTPVPLEPTEQQWSGLARDIMMGYDLGAKSPRALLQHLQFSGATAPEWLRHELGDGTGEAVLSKGSRCVLIYKAMVHAIKQDGE